MVARMQCIKTAHHPLIRPFKTQTKNISGRLLVGMRWWNDVGDDQTNEGSNWRFESLAEVWHAVIMTTIVCTTAGAHIHTENTQGQRNINSKDSQVFWTALYATVCFVRRFLDMLCLYACCRACC